MDHPKDRLAAAQGLERQLRNWFLNNEQFIEDVKAHLGYLGIDDAEGRALALNKHGFIDEVVFDAIFISANGYGGLFKPKDFWDKLIQAGIIVKYFKQDFFMFGHYYVDQIILTNHLNERTFINIFFGPSFFYNRYSNSIVSIDVKDKNGDDFRGSGFFTGKIYDNINIAQIYFIITCRHNVENKNSLTIATASGICANVIEIVLSDRIDLAIVSASICLPDYPIALETNVDVFDETYTIGFPRVPRAHSTLLGHRGEVNALANRYAEGDRVLVISNLVSPGSSGCPVLDRGGRCVGMTINWLEERYLDDQGGESTARFSAAIPSTEIKAEIERLNLAWW